MSLEQFTEFLFEKDDGYAYVATLNRKANDFKQHFFRWPEQSQELHDLVKTSASEADVYLSPVLYSEKRSKKEYVKSSNVVWVEFDGQEVINFKGLPQPSVIVQTSTDSHLHCYWKVPKGATANAIEDINRRLTYFLDADSSGWDINQILRPPETFNRKTIQAKPVKLLRCTDDRFEFNGFDSAPDISLAVKEYTFDELLDIRRIDLPDDLRHTITDAEPKPNGRSTLLMSAAYKLAEYGLDHHTIVSCLFTLDCRIKKFIGRDDQLVRLSEIAAIAIAKTEPDLAVYSPSDIIKQQGTIEWIMERLLHKTGMMFLSGAPGVGKTQLSFDLCYRLTTGTEFLGKAIARPVRCIYFSLEMDVLELKYIFEHQIKDFTDKQELWNQNLQIIDLEEPTLKNFEKAIKEAKPDVIFFDSLTEMTIDDSDVAEAKKVMKWFRKIRKKYNCAIVCIHHNRKAQENNKRPLKLSDLYGSFIFGAKTDSVLVLHDPDSVNYLELLVLKARFDQKETIRVKRSENLTFSIDEVTDVTIEPGGNPLIKANLSLG